MATKGKPWVNKIVGHEDVNPELLQAHPDNWRVHNRLQQDALDGVIQDVGYIRSITVNKRNNRILDGHLRWSKALARGEDTIPVEWVDLEPAEEAEALLTIDPVAAMAGGDKERVDRLLEQIHTEDQAVTDMLANLASDLGLYAEEEAEQQGEDPEIPFSPELMLEHNYIILYFDNPLDWQVAVEQFGLKKVRSRAPTPGSQKVGIGKVVRGAEYLDRS